MDDKLPPFRLIKRPANAMSSPSRRKRFKSTGLEYELRQLDASGRIQTNCEIHGSIEIDPVSHALIDTEVFQRLRNIKQLGSSDYTYSGANGNRFTHSLGVMHLADKMVRVIKEEQPNLGCTDKDVLCVKLAGLLHDLGHGAYSHLYESFRFNSLPNFLAAHPDLRKEYNDCKEEVPKNWTHELSSLQMIDACLEELGLAIDLENLDSPLKQIGDGLKADSFKVFKPPGLSPELSVLTSRDFVFIKECILGHPLPEVEEKLDVRDFIGRTQKHQEWMYNIVNNSHSGLDVDKIDYFARDHARAMGAGTGKVDVKMIEDARVSQAKCSDPDKCVRCRGDRDCIHFMISYPKKHTFSAMNFFKTRILLHSLIYQHKKTVAVGSMIGDVLCLADPYFRLESRDGETFPISRAVLKSRYLIELDDNIINDIYRSKDPRLEEAQALIRRIRKHDLYKCAVEQPLDIDSYNQSVFDDVDEEDTSIQDSLRDKKIWKMSDKEIKDGMLAEFQRWKPSSSNGNSSLEDSDFTVEKYYMHHGKKDRNPMLDMRFFDEMNDKLTGPIEGLPMSERARERDYRSIIPLSLQKAGVRIFVREGSKRELANQVFLQWFERMAQLDCDEGKTPFPSAFEMHEESDDEDDADNQMDGNDHSQNAVMLSQESDMDDEDDRSRTHACLDQSPIPVRTR